MKETNSSLKLTIFYLQSSLGKINFLQGFLWNGGSSVSCKISKKLRLKFCCYPKLLIDIPEHFSLNYRSSKQYFRIIGYQMRLK